MFGKKPADIATREKLEKNLVTIFDNYHSHANNPPWIESQEFGQYLDVQKAIIQYYQEHTDNVIGLELLDICLETMEIGRAILASNDRTEEEKETAKYQISSVEYLLHEIMKAAMIYNTEDYEGE